MDKDKELIAIDFITKHLAALSRRPQLNLKKFPSLQESLEKFIETDPKEWMTPSQNLWGIRVILDNLEESETVDFLRDGFAELLERFQSKSSIPKQLSLYLWLFAAIEEDLAGKSPLTIKYSMEIRGTESHEYIYYLLFSCCLCVLKRSSSTKKEILANMKEIVENSKLEQKAYLNYITLQQNYENSTSLEENDHIDIQKMSKREIELLEVYAIILEFPGLIYSFLKWYFGDLKIKPVDIVKELEKMSRFLHETGNSTLGIFPFEFSQLLPRIINRSIFSLDFGEYSNDLYMFFKNRNIYELWPPQVKAIRKIKSVKNSYFIIQPTGSGKSLIAHVWIYLLYKRSEDKQIIYIVPTKSLAYQTKNDLDKIFGVYGIAVSNLSGVQLHPILDMARRRLSNIIVMTSEKFNFLYQNGEFEKNMPSTIIIDEAHSIFGEEIRDFKSAISLLKVRLNLTDVPVLALSGVMEDPKLVRKWEIINLNNVKSDWRSTRLKVYLVDQQRNRALPYFSHIEDYLDYEINFPILFKSLNVRKKHVSMLLKHYIYQPEYQTAIVFCNSRNRAEKFAKEISTTIKFKLKNSELIKKREELLTLVKQTLGSDSLLIKYIKSGVAFHHAGIPSELGYKLLDALNLRVIKIIVATTTLAEGLNTPADIVVIPYDYFYDNIFMNKDMSMTTIKNMVGRAGRAAHGGIGLAFIYPSDIEKFQERGVYDKLKQVRDFSESFQFQENKILGEFNPANYYIPEILQFRPAIFSLICENLINSYNPELFITKLDAFKSYMYGSKIKNTITAFNSLKNLLVEASPLKPTSLGWIAYQTGLDPFSFNNTISYLNNNLKKIVPLMKKRFLSLDKTERSTILKLFFVPDEARIPKFHQIPVEDRLHLLVAWLNSNSSLLMAKEEFYSNKEIVNEDVYDIFEFSTTIYGELSKTLPWTAWCILQILQHHYSIDIHPSYSLIPLYIRSGTLEPLRAILNSFQISPKNIDKICSLIPSDLNNDLDISKLFKWILYDLRLSVKRKFEDIDDLGLIELQVIGSQFEKDNNKTLFLATYYACWYDLAINALKPLKITSKYFFDDLIFECLDIITRNYKEYITFKRDHRSIEGYLNLLESLIYKKELKDSSKIQLKILKKLLDKYKFDFSYSESINKIISSVIKN